MVSIKINSVGRKDLKIGTIYIPEGETHVFAKISDISISKPGKHGPAKTITCARNIINGKSINNVTFKDSDSNIQVVADFCYMYKVVYSTTESEMCINLETGETIPYMYFVNNDDSAVKKAVEAEKAKLNENLLNEKGEPLIIKYSELDETKSKLIFWECIYSPISDLSRYGITDYVA